MKIKQAIAQLSLKQEALCRTEFKNQKHKEVQEVFSKHIATLGGYAKPIAEILTALIGAEVTPAITNLYELFCVAADGSNNQVIILGAGNGTAFGIIIPTAGDAILPASYTQINNSWRVLTGEERRQVLNRFLANKWKDDQVVEWVATKLGGGHMTNFIKLTFEAAENL